MRWAAKSIKNFVDKKSNSIFLFLCNSTIWFVVISSERNDICGVENSAKSLKKLTMADENLEFNFVIER